ncbi:MAG: EcoAI/FtnUII family type I restriction enzme subunit R [Opitutales bacterium]
MNEAETRAELIDPALREAGWGVVEGSRVRREVITLGRIEGAAQGASLRRGERDIADYVLMYRNQKLAVIEAKSRAKEVTEGLGQAKKYAEKIQARFALSTNGDGIYEADIQAGSEGPIDRYPTPDELWNRVFAEQNQWRNRFADVPFEEKGGAWEVRYYQHNAINNVLEAIAKGQKRILLTMATGTGKTAVAFQLAWKLFHSRWNLSGEPNRRPRILFLADRNILANQAFNAFSAFPDDALVRIDPESIRKKGSVPKSGSIFFTIFQTFMTASPGYIDTEETPTSGEPNFGDYPPDFFDFIVIDECHRGGSNDESTWRAILEYFSPAVQLGLTATPKRNNNVDTYAYFGEPVYIYSLKEGINDGYLTPFRVKQISTTLDEYTYTSDDVVKEGEVEVGQHFDEPEFNRIIEIRERERYRVQLFMERIDQGEKTLVFCATQEHALAVRDLINQLKTNPASNYCVRVTANEGAIGDQHLRTFQDNEKSLPTILTTSQKLSTGVDALDVRNIVLMRSVNSIIEFKQIIGRGTRLYEGKAYFTIYDFVKAYEHFNDPEWDGEPVEPEPPNPRPPPDPDPDPPGPGPKPPPPDPPRKKVKIKLADGKERQIQNMVATSFWSPDGKPMSATEFIERLFGDLPELFRDENELRKLWSQPETRRKLLDGLAERGYGEEQLHEMAILINAEKSDIYDVLAYVAYAHAPITREERVNDHKTVIFAQYDPKQQDFLDFILSQYVDQGVSELDQDKLPDLLELKYDTVNDAIARLGSVQNIRDVFVGFQKYLYDAETVA